MDLATLVTKGMHLIGRDDLVPDANSLDNHSTITLSMSDQQEIHMTCTDGQPVIWAMLPGDFSPLRQEVKGDLLDAVTAEGSTLFFLGHPALRLTDNGAELAACYTPEAVSDAEPFIQALDQFISLYQHCYSLMLRN